MSHLLRSGATAVAVASGLAVLSYTGQTADGFVNAGFSGPLGVFGSSASDAQAEVLNIGDGPNDATELASLLQTATSDGSPTAPYRVAFEAGSTPKTSELNVFTGVPASAATSEQALRLGTNPLIKAGDRADCAGATSCVLDPVTNVTTVTYPDGIVALVQKINDMTVVAYQTVSGAVQKQLPFTLPSGSLPPGLLPSGLLPAAILPTPTQAPMPAAAVVAAPVPTNTPPVVDPGPPASLPSASSLRNGPKLSVTRPPLDFTPGRTGTSSGSGANTPVMAPGVSGAVTAVKDAVGSVVGAIGDAVGKAIGPGASNQTTSK